MMTDLQSPLVSILNRIMYKRKSMQESEKGTRSDEKNWIHSIQSTGRQK